MKRVVVIMAGGRGERFWPASRAQKPKQFLSLTGDGKSMLRHTVERVLPLTGYDGIFIVTNDAYARIVREQLPELSAENILLEPMGRNTAPCIGLAAEVLSRKYGDALMIVLPADHIIHEEEVFRRTLLDACEVAQASDYLVTLGITPNYPETGYGYLRFDAREKGPHGEHAVRRFVEKPDEATAREYLASGEYLWNSGMFIWRVSVILDAIAALLPDLRQGLSRIGAALDTNQADAVLRECFDAFTPISIDYGVLEKAERVYTIPSSFGWDDVGSWLALERIRTPDADGNVVDANVRLVEARGNIIVGEERLIALVGVSGLVVIDTPDALLICHRDKTQLIRSVADK